MQNTENSCKNFVGLLSLVELITYSYLHQERVLSLWLEGKSEINESVISHWAKGRIYLNYFQILITVALHTLRHEFSWQPHSFTHHAFAAQVPIFLRNRYNKIVFVYRDNFFHDTLLLQALSNHRKRNKSISMITEISWHRLENSISSTATVFISLIPSNICCWQRQGILAMRYLWSNTISQFPR